MERHASTLRARQRLEQLAQHAGLPLNDIPPKLRREPASFLSSGDKEIAEDLLKQKRQEAFSSKTHVFRRKPSQSDYKQDEIDTALDSIVRNNGSPGVLE